MTNGRKFTLLRGEKQSAEEAKKSLRRRMKETRALVDNKDVKESLLIENFFSALREAGREEANTFFVYLSYSSEARTDRLIEELQARGKKVYSPRVDGKEMQLIEFGEDFSLSDKGIREPIGDVYDGEIEVVILPLLAVDKEGYRLGYGGGYYDRFLHNHPESMAVGYGYDVQIVDEVPREAWDKKVDAVVTDKRILWIKN